MDSGGWDGNRFVFMDAAVAGRDAYSLRGNNISIIPEDLVQYTIHHYSIPQVLGMCVQYLVYQRSFHEYTQYVWVKELCP